MARAAATEPDAASASLFDIQDQLLLPVSHIQAQPTCVAIWQLDELSPQQLQGTMRFGIITKLLKERMLKHYSIF